MGCPKRPRSHGSWWSGRRASGLSIGARLVFAVTDADGAATIRIVGASSGRLVNIVDAPFAVDDIAVDTRLNELLPFGRGANWICRIPIDDPCVLGAAARLRVALATGAVSRTAIPSAALVSMVPVLQRKPSCCGGYGCACCGGGGGRGRNTT